MATLDLTLDRSLGAVELGVLFSTVLYGIASLQAFLYAERNFKDPLWLKTMVGLVWILETAHTVFIWDVLYSWTVTQYGQRSAIDDTSWSFALEFVFSATLGSIVQSFFGYRIWALSGSLIVPVIAWSGALLRFTLGIFRGVELMHSKTIPTFFAHYKWLFTAGLSFNVAIDTLNTVALCFYLLRRRTGVESTQKMVDKLILYTVEIGLVTSICALAIAIAVNLQHANLIYLGIFFVYPKLFSNSLFTALNARQALRDTGLDTHATDFQGTASQRHEPDNVGQEIVLEFSSRRSNDSKTASPPLSISWAIEIANDPGLSRPHA